MQPNMTYTAFVCCPTNNSITENHHEAAFQLNRVAVRAVNALVISIIALFFGCASYESSSGRIRDDGGSIVKTSYPVLDEIEEDPDSGMSHDELLKTGIELLGRKKYEEAEEKFLTALQFDASSRDAALSLGFCVMMQGRYAEGEEIFFELQERHPFLVEACLGRAAAKYLAGDEKGAREVVEQGLLTLPDGPEKDRWKERISREAPFPVILD